MFLDFISLPCVSQWQNGPDITEQTVLFLSIMSSEILPVTPAHSLPITPPFIQVRSLSRTLFCSFLFLNQEFKKLMNEMLNFTFKSQCFLHRQVQSLLELTCPYQREYLIPLVILEKKNIFYSLWAFKIWLCTSKESWKLITTLVCPVLCFTSHPPLLHITWNLVKGLILHPADRLAAMLSHLQTFCETLIIFYHCPPLAKATTLQQASILLERMEFF